MNFRLPLIAAFVALLAISACGGGSSTDPANPGGSAAVTTLSQVDTKVGDGAIATAGFPIAVRYTLWLYDSKAANFKGTQVESNVNATTPFYFVLGSSSVITGWNQGVAGMKVNGTRTLVIPASLAYGANASTTVPANQALVFDITLVNTFPVTDAKSLVVKDVLVGDGATAAAAPNVLSITYTPYLYTDDPAAVDHKGLPVSASGLATALTGTVSLATTSTSIPGLVQGLTGIRLNGTRTIIIPSGMAYGTAGGSGVPPNSGVVYDVKVTALAAQ
jgi:peptidylprolyl isomerase